MSLFSPASKYRQRGWNVLPLRGKTPAIPYEEFRTRKQTDSEFRSAFHLGGLTGIAVVLGRVSEDAFVRDFDKRESFDRWKFEYSDYARALPIVATPRPGFHVYGRGHVPKKIDFGDGELRGELCLCVLPPSIVDGKQYFWCPDNPLPDGELLRIDPETTGLARAWTTTIQPLHAVRAVVSRSVTPVEIRSIDDVVAISAPTRLHSTDAMALVFGQAMRSYEAHIGRPLSEAENIEAIGKWYAETESRGFAFAPYEAYENKYLRALRNIKYPLGYNPLSPAFERAATAAAPKIAVQLKLSLPATALATFCREAQIVVGLNRVFFVSCSDISKLLPALRTIDTKNIWEILNTLERRGIIKKVSPGKPRSKDCRAGEAASFRYLHSLDE